MSRWTEELGMSEDEQTHLRAILTKVQAATGRVRHWPDQQLLRLLEHGRALNDWPLLIKECDRIARKAALAGVDIRTLGYLISATMEIDTGRRPLEPRDGPPGVERDYDNSMAGWTREQVEAARRLRERFLRDQEDG